MENPVFLQPDKMGSTRNNALTCNPFNLFPSLEFNGPLTNDPARTPHVSKFFAVFCHANLKNHPSSLLAAMEGKRN